MERPADTTFYRLLHRAMVASAERLADVRKRVNRLPLGAAALAGTSYPLDRERVAKTLGFDGVCQNSLDAVKNVPQTAWGIDTKTNQVVVKVYDAASKAMVPAKASGNHTSCQRG